MLSIICILPFLVSIAIAQLSFYPNDTLVVSGNISTGCYNALNTSINCDSYILSLAAADDFSSLNNDTVQKSVCASGCGAALSSYHDSVARACAQDPMPWEGVPATYLGDFVWAYYNGSCLKDPATGTWCKDYITNISSSLTGELQIGELPKAQLCSPCIIQLFKHQQSTAFSNYDNVMAADWASVQKVCSTTGPTAVPTPYATPTDKPGHVPSNVTLASPTCLSGNYYTVQSGDDPQKIAVALKVATGTLKILNDILPDGSNLLAGAKLCLPNTCTTYLVQSGDTCWQIAMNNSISFTELLAYNPSINNDCSNLLSGTNICVSLPGSSWNGTTIGGATATKTNQYATSTAAIPTDAAPRTTRKCGKWYTVQYGDYCQLVALNNTISLELFTLINPSINSTCGNLNVGLSYCVWPTSGWNATGICSAVAAPASTPPGTTNKCCEWYVIQSGDTCYKIEQAYEISMTQLQTWNPDLHSDCGNLLVKEAYCVSALNTTASPTTSSPASTPTPPGPTQSGIAANCNKYVLQKDGAYCQDMANAAGITLDNLYKWNPGLGGNCSGLWPGYAYCIGVSS